MTHTIKIDTEIIKLPDDIAKKLIGKEVQLIELQNGLMLKTKSNPIKEARGILKKKRFSTEKYFENKKENKALE